MKVVILMENSTCRDTVACAHGLSMYIETDKHKILFDMGPDAQFIDNAKALGVDLTQVDIAFLSHAHNDHCGGLEAFLKLNDRAKVYMQKAVWGQYYVVTPSKCAYIGMDAVLKNYEDRFVLCDGVQIIYLVIHNSGCRAVLPCIRTYTLSIALVTIRPCYRLSVNPPVCPSSRSAIHPHKCRMVRICLFLTLGTDGRKVLRTLIRKDLPSVPHPNHVANKQ